MIYDRKTYEERRDAMLSRQVWIVNAITAFGVIASIILLYMFG